MRELLEAVHKYDYDLRRAAEPQLLAQMKANRLADMKAVRGKHFDPNDPDGEEQEILGILPTHPMVTAVSGATDSAKLLRHLEKAEAKGRLDTLYDAACWTICAGAIRWWTKPSKPSRILSGSISAAPAR